MMDEIAKYGCLSLFKIHILSNIMIRSFFIPKRGLFRTFWCFSVDFLLTFCCKINRKSPGSLQLIRNKLNFDTALIWCRYCYCWFKRLKMDLRDNTTKNTRQILVPGLLKNRTCNFFYYLEVIFHTIKK